MIGEEITCRPYEDNGTSSWYPIFRMTKHAGRILIRSLLGKYRAKELVYFILKKKIDHPTGSSRCCAIYTNCV